MNKENLAKLADYIEKDVTQEMFDMEHYRSNSGSPCEYIDEDNCGTVGCALGWAPFVKGLGVVDSDFRFSWTDDGYVAALSFGNYVDRVFDLHPVDFDFLFGGFWSIYDNTPQGFVKRALHLINGGESMEPAMWLELIND